MTVYIKAEYASVPFLVLAFALVKWSISVAINYLSPDTLHRRVNTGLAVVVLLWIVPVIFTSVFQCAPPALWDFVNGTRCLNRVRFSSSLLPLILYALGEMIS